MAVDSLRIKHWTMITISQRQRSLSLIICKKIARWVLKLMYSTRHSTASETCRGCRRKSQKESTLSRSETHKLIHLNFSVKINPIKSKSCVKSRIHSIKALNNWQEQEQTPLFSYLEATMTRWIRFKVGCTAMLKS